jgi:hypothetical protein
MLGGADGLINHLQNVRSDEVSLAEDANAGSVPLENIAVHYQLLELNLCELHQAFYLILWAVEVLYAERIDGYRLDTALVANLKYLQQA